MTFELFQGQLFLSNTSRIQTIKYALFREWWVYLTTQLFFTCTGFKFQGSSHYGVSEEIPHYEVYI